MRSEASEQAEGTSEQRKLLARRASVLGGVKHTHVALARYAGWRARCACHSQSDSWPDAVDRSSKVCNQQVTTNWRRDFDPALQSDWLVLVGGV